MLVTQQPAAFSADIRSFAHAGHAASVAVSTPTSGAWLGAAPSTRSSPFYFVDVVAKVSNRILKVCKANNKAQVPSSSVDSCCS